MAFRIGFFKTPKHNVFHYQPLYWDPEKEARQKRVAEARERAAMAKTEEEKAKAEAQADALEESLLGQEKHYIPGMSIRGSFSKGYQRSKRYPANQGIVRFVVVISIAVLVGCALYFTNIMSLLFQAVAK